MALEYQILNRARPDDGLELYCRLEGLDPAYMRSAAEKERGRRKEKNGFFKRKRPVGGKDI